jgi:hypothetical protein
MTRLVPEPALITPRRHFLRVLGYTAAGLPKPIPVLFADTAEQRVALQLAQLTRALQALHPRAFLTSDFRRDFHENPSRAGDIVAVVRPIRAI